VCEVESQRAFAGNAKAQPDAGISEAAVGARPIPRARGIDKRGTGQRQ
jgi:hypothetical protein